VVVAVRAASSRPRAAVVELGQDTVDTQYAAQGSYSLLEGLRLPVLVVGVIERVTLQAIPYDA